VKVYESELLLESVSDEIGERSLNGLLVSACTENETASASTPLTDGCSAFTYALQEVIRKGGLSLSALAIAKQATAILRRTGFSQTPQVKVPKELAGMAEGSFLVIGEAAKEERQAFSTEAGHPLTTLIEALLRNWSSGSQDRESNRSSAQKEDGMNLQSLAPIILALSQNKSGGSDKSLLENLLPVVLPHLIEAITKSGSKGLFDSILPTQPPIPPWVPMILSATTNKGAQDKLFGIDDAILIPAIAAIVTAAVSKKSNSQQKLFGIDDAILIPAIAGVLSTVISQKSAPQQKLFGIDDAILIPAIVSVATAVINR
jgi:hypothetical protein